MLVRSFSWPRFSAISFWLFYVALEPYVRRNWPDALVSWSRFCNRKFQDPVVASHILVGIVAADAFALTVRPGFSALSGGFSVLQVGDVAFASLLRFSIIMFAFGLAFALVAALLRRFKGSTGCRTLSWRASSHLRVGLRITGSPPHG